jgi:hypothetical protein
MCAVQQETLRKQEHLLRLVSMSAVDPTNYKVISLSSRMRDQTGR